MMPIKYINYTHRRDSMELRVDRIHKSFGEKGVLEGISFNANSGSAMGLLGRNGAGKTTTMRIILGVFPPNSGHILVDGKPIDRKNMSIGYLPEDRGLYPKQPIDKQLLYLSRLRGCKTRDAKESIARWLKRLGMEEYASKKLNTLSKGNQQKIQLVAALINEPELVILDEPFSGLDPVNATILKDVVKEVISEGRIVLFSSHQMNYVEEFCDSIAILHNGKIVLDGKISDIKRSYDRNIITIRSQDNDVIEDFCNNTLSDIVTGTGRMRDELLVTLRAPEEMNSLVSALTAQRIEFDSIGIHEPSLAEIFVQYTGDEEEKSA